MINYIRRCVHLNTCLQCGDIFPDQVMMMMIKIMMIMMIPPLQSSLLEHMTWSGHHVPGPSSDWDQPQYYFPTYENDNLLCGLEVSGKVIYLKIKELFVCVQDDAEDRDSEDTGFQSDPGPGPSSSFPPVQVILTSHWSIPSPY